MSLANLIIRSIVVQYDDNRDHDVRLYGLTPDDIAGIIIEQKGCLEAVFDAAEAAGVNSVEDIGKVDVAKIGMRLLAQVPMFLATVIAYAAREPYEADKVRMLDAPTQMRMLNAVAELSFRDIAGFQEFVGNVVAAMRSAKAALPQQARSLGSNASLSGGSESAAPSLS